MADSPKPCRDQSGDYAMSSVLMSDGLEEAVASTRPVHGLTHNFYRYPARFNPEFVRQVILSFTKPHDCVLDPFVGGGTTIVEAVALGRRAIGIDLNSLAYFTSQVKTTPLSSNDIDSIGRWADDVLKPQGAPPPGDIITRQSALFNMPSDIAEFLARAGDLASGLQFPRQQRFARCAVIRTGQLALDCKYRLPRLDEVKMTFARLITSMIVGLDEFVGMAKSSGIPRNKVTSMRQLYLGSAASSVVDRILSSTFPKPTLVLTSPPYPQIHVLYNKWQILGRRETSAHYWFGTLKDGHYPSFYTMGARSRKGQEAYFQNLFGAFSNLKRLVTPKTVLVQLVAFPDEELVKSRYLLTLTQAGFEPIDIHDSGKSSMTTRIVPNRKWYAYLHDRQFSSHEVLMIHRPTI
jgi:hypothetical protein